MRKALVLLAVVAGALLFPAPAQAAIAVESKCHTGWYVNDDEAALAPKQLPAGFEFDGPSLVHRALTTPVAIAVTPANGSFTADLKAGVLPLFKMETTSPYSTINKTATGKYWSSKIATGPGSQAAPVDTLVALAALAPYGESSKVYSFGVGYANDTGNAAVVKSITFGTSTLNLACVPASPSASASASASPAPSTSSSTTPVAEPGGSLAITGARTWAWVTAGLALVVIGGLLVFAGRRRMFRWQR